MPKGTKKAQKEALLEGEDSIESENTKGNSKIKSQSKYVNHHN